MIEGRIVPGQGDKTDIFAIRMEVFVGEQGFAAETETDAIDEVALHALVLDGGKPAATARLYQQEGVYHIGRVAVRRAFRGRHLGEMAMRMLMVKAADLGAGEVHVGAQRQAEGFYARLGFEPCGPEYLDEDVPHVPMKAVVGDGCGCGCGGCHGGASHG